MIPKHWVPEDEELAKIANQPLDTPEQRKKALADPAFRMWVAANGDVARAQAHAASAQAEVSRLRALLMQAGVDPDKE